jgi:filamentous hemagglutinin family protein
MTRKRYDAQISKRQATLGQRIVCALIVATYGSAYANPIDPTVISGQASFQQQGATLTVTNSPNAIINWQAFSIGASETTRFVQQSSASSVLNRVTGVDPSIILGSLQSNGQVLLLNPNGMLFGQGARIDVAGLVASTLNLSNEDYLNGNLNFTGGALAGSIKNEGAITTPGGGSVLLIAPDITNSGLITAPDGNVILAAGHSVRLGDTTAPNVLVEISAPDTNAVNLGQIVVGSGKAGIYAGIVQQKGIVSADTVSTNAAGKIVFKATKDVTLDAGSRTTANGASGGQILVQAETGTNLINGVVEAKGHPRLPGESNVPPLPPGQGNTWSAAEGVGEGKGGGIQLLGTQVGVAGNAVVDASGSTGGGQILVGGDYKGQNTAIQNARATYFGGDAELIANATNTGSGGRIILWSDEVTRAYGQISAKGATNGGNGGFVETSSKGHLDVTRAPDIGSGGLWLLDPSNITVIAGLSGTGTIDIFGPPTFSSTVSNSTVSNGVINAALDLDTSVTIDTTSSALDEGNITINAPITKSIGGVATLTLNADNNIVANASITNTGTSLGLNLSLISGVSTPSGATTMFGGMNLGTGNFSANKDVSLFNPDYTLGGLLNIQGKLTLGGNTKLTLGYNATPHVVTGEIFLDPNSGGFLTLKGIPDLVLGMPTLQADGGLSISDPNLPGPGVVFLDALDIITPASTGTVVFNTHTLTFQNNAALNTANLNITSGLIQGSGSLSVNTDFTASGGSIQMTKSPSGTAPALYQSSVYLTSLNGSLPQIPVRADRVEINAAGSTSAINVAGVSTSVVANHLVLTQGLGDLLLTAPLVADRIELTTLNGSILDANTIGPEIVAKSTRLRAAGRIGTAIDRLDTSVEFLDADTSSSVAGSGGIYVANTLAGSPLHLLGAYAGLNNLSITNNSDILIGRNVNDGNFPSVGSVGGDIIIESTAGSIGNDAGASFPYAPQARISANFLTPFSGAPPGNAGTVTLIASGNIDLPTSLIEAKGSNHTAPGAGGLVNLQAGGFINVATVDVRGGDALPSGATDVAGGNGGSINLTGGSINFVGNAILKSAAGASIGAPLLPTNGNVNLTAGAGGILQTGALSVDTPQFSFSSAGNVTLVNAANAYSGISGTVTGGNLALVDSTNLTTGALSATGHINVSVNAANGVLTLGGNVVAGGNVAYVVDDFQVNSNTTSGSGPSNFVQYRPFTSNKVFNLDGNGAEFAKFITPTLRLGDASPGAYSGDVNIAFTGPVDVSNFKNLSIFTEGNVIQNAGSSIRLNQSGSGLQVSASKVSMEDVGNIFGVLAGQAKISGSDSFKVTNNGSFTVGEVDGVTSIGALAGSTGNSLTSATGSINIASGFLVNAPWTLNSALGTTNALGSTVNIDASNITVNGGLVNQGIISLTNLAGSAQLTVSGGTLLNDASGIIDSTGTGAATNTLSLSGTPALNNLGQINANRSLQVTASSSVNMSAGVMSVAGGESLHITGGAAFNVSGGTLTGAGAVTVNGPFNWTGGLLSGTGLLTTNGPSSIDLGGGSLGKNWLNNGTVDLLGAPLLNVTAGNTFTNAAIGVFNVNGTNANAIGGAGTFLNQGTLNKNNAVTQNFTANLTNNGTLNVNAGILQVSGNAIDSGAYNVNAGNTLQFTGGTRTLNGSSSVNGAGTLDFSGATVNANGNLGISSTGSVLFTGGIVNLDTPSPTLTFPGAITLSGATLNATDDIVATGINWTGGSLNGTGLLTTSGASTINAGGGALGKNWVNNGTVDLSGAPLLNVTAGNTFTNAAAGVFNVNGANTNAIGGAGTFLNQGTLNKNNPVTQNFTANLTNSGTLNVNAGILQVSGNATDSGAYNVNTGNTLQFTSGTRTLNGSSSVNGAGTLDFAGATVNANASLSIIGSGSVLFSGGIVNLDTPTPTLTFPGAVTLSGATLNAIDDIVATGINWTGGSLNGTGLLTTSGASTINAGGGALGKNWVNNGTVDLSGAPLFNVTAGNTFTNAAAGVFNVNGTNSNAIGGAGTFLNQGTLNKNNAITQNFTANLTNNGTLNVNAGILQISGSPANAGTLNIVAGTTVSTGGANLTNAGTITGNGTLDLGAATLTNDGLLTPGGAATAGTLSITGNLANAGSGTIDADIGGTAPGTQYDRINVSGTATLGGTLNGSLIGGFTPNAQSFDIISAASMSGSFTASSLPLGVNGAIVGGLYRLTHSGGTCVGVCWDGGAGTALWSDALNWTTDLLPGTNDLVQLNLVAGVTVDHTIGNDSIRGLNSIANNNLIISGGSITLNDPATTSTLLGALTLSGGTLTSNGTLNTSAFNLSAGTLGGTGAVNLNGVFNWTGGTLGGTGLLTSNNASTISLGGGTLNKDWINNATVDLQGTASLTVGAGNSVTNASGRTFNIASTNATGLGGPGAFINQGTLNKNAAGTQTFTALLTNSGTVNVNAGTLALNNGDAGGGSYNIAGLATLSLGGGGMTYGIGNIADAGTLNLSAGTLNVGSLTGTGSFNVTGGAANLSTANHTGSATANGGVLNLAGGNLGLVTVGPAIGSQLNLSGTSTVNSIADSGAVTVTGGTATINALFGAGTFVVAGGTANLSGANHTGATAANGGVLNMSGGNLGTVTVGPTVGSQLNLSGISTVTSIADNGVVTVSGGTATISALTGAGAFNVTAGTANLSGANHTGAITVDGGVLSDIGGNLNAVTVGPTAGSQLGLRASTVASIADSGVVAVTGGTVTIGALTGAGAFSVSSGTANLSGANHTGATTANGGVLNLAGGNLGAVTVGPTAGSQLNLRGTSAVTSIADGGAVTVTGGTTTINALTGAGTFDVTGGTANLSGANHSGVTGVTLGALNLLGGNLGTVNVGALGSQFNVSGTGNTQALNVAGGAVDISGSLTTANLTLTSGSVAGSGNLSVTNNFLQTSGILGATFANLNLTRQGNFIVGAYDATNSLSLNAAGGDLVITNLTLDVPIINLSGANVLVDSSTVGSATTQSLTVNATGAFDVTASATSASVRANAVNVSTNTVTLTGGTGVDAYAAIVGRAGGTTVTALTAINLIAGMGQNADAVILAGNGIPIVTTANCTGCTVLLEDPFTDPLTNVGLFDTSVSMVPVDNSIIYAATLAESGGEANTEIGEEEEKKEDQASNTEGKKDDGEKQKAALPVCI